MVGMGETRSMVGMTLPAIPTVQSQKSLGFSMPKRERYRAAFSKRLQLPRRKSQPAWRSSRLEFERSSYRVNDRSKGVILPLDHRVRQMDRKRTKPLR